MVTTRITRRRFVKRSCERVAAIALPVAISARALAKPAPSDTLQIACIGTGRMGHGDMHECLRQGLVSGVNARVVAVCDLDRHRAEHARQEAESFYAQQPTDGRPPIAIFDDYRELLARPEIDGVTISTPDHWHALVAIAAAQAGKDIYLQKPLTYTIAEGQKLVRAVRGNKVVLQTGSQQRSDANFRHACELVRNGDIGTLRAMRVVMPIDQGTGNSTARPVPPNLNYDMWLGPAATREYAEEGVHPQTGFGRPGWLQIESFCRGMITGWGSHMFDIAQWGNNSDDTGPIEIQAEGQFPDRGLFNVHTTFHAEGVYANGVKLYAESGPVPGVRFEGDRGWIRVGRSLLEANPSPIIARKIRDEETRLDRSDNHMRNFLECMRSRKDPICPVETGHRSNSICVVTHLAMKLGRKLHWDPQIEQFPDDAEANAMLDYNHRQPWSV